MTKEEMISKLETIDLKKDVSTLYEILDELNIKYKKTACLRCRNDLRNIALEELGSIKNAANLSDFNGKYIYLKKRPQSWNGHIIDGNTDVEVIVEFMKEHKGFYKVVSSEE